MREPLRAYTQLVLPRQLRGALSKSDSTLNPGKIIDLVEKTTVYYVLDPTLFAPPVKA